MWHADDRVYNEHREWIELWLYPCQNGPIVCLWRAATGELNVLHIVEISVFVCGDSTECEEISIERQRQVMVSSKNLDAQEAPSDDERQYDTCKVLHGPTDPCLVLCD